MGQARHHYINLLLLFTFIVSAPFLIQGSTTQALLPSPKSPFQREMYMKGHSGGHIGRRNWRRLMIGSTAPTCTYNECRGCKNKCRAEQVPVEGNDPANSAYHYRCVCQRL